MVKQERIILDYTVKSDPLLYIYSRRIQIFVLITVILISLAVAYYLRPLIDGVIFGMLFAYITRPIKNYLNQYTKYSAHLATICILLPLVLLLLYGLIEVRAQLVWISGHRAETIEWITSLLYSFNIPVERFELTKVLGSVASYGLSSLVSLPILETASWLLLLAMNLLVSIFTCFYLLKDGGELIVSLKKLTPAGMRPQIEYFLNEADMILNGIYIGTFYTALFIAFASAVIFFLFGIPYLILCTAFVFIAALIPVLSGMMVILPLTVYEYFSGGPVRAILFLVSCIIFVYLPPDYLIRPYLINRASNLHPLLIILSFIGGGLAGGISGFFAAPLAVGLMVAAYRTYLKYGERIDEGLY